MIENKTKKTNRLMFVIALLLWCAASAATVATATEMTSTQVTFLDWTSDLDSSIMQTPIVKNLWSIKSSHQQCSELSVVVPSFQRSIEMLDARDGSESVDRGFPFQHRRFTSQSSPLMFDIDADGHEELLQATAKAEIFFLRLGGGVDSSSARSILPEYTLKIQPLKVHRDWYKGMPSDADHSMSLVSVKKGRRKPLSAAAAPAPAPAAPAPAPQPHTKTSKRRHKWSAEHKLSSKILYQQPVSMRVYVDTEEQDYSPIENPFFALGFREELQRRKNEAKDTDEIFVDAHILSTPVLADIDNDGKDELIVGVSYYYDPQFYAIPEHRERLDPSIQDLDKYVAGGIVVYKLAPGEGTQPQLLWQAQLDLTAATSRFASYVYATPTIADIDSDGNLEIIVTTTLGYVYVFDKHGSVKEGWPQQVAPIRSSALAEDINADGDLEVCVSSEDKHVYCFRPDGTLLWKSNVDGFTVHGLSLGDVDANGVMDIVLATSEKQVWVLQGDTGKVVPNFPATLGGEIYAMVTLLMAGDKQPLDLIVPCMDGRLYIINGATGKFNKIDTGEMSYTQALVIPSLGDEKLNLLLGGMDGTVHSFATNVPYHPLKTVMQSYGYANGAVQRYGFHGIHVLPSSRVCRDILGSTFKVAFEIVDNRKMPSHIPRSYAIKIAVGNKIVLYEGRYTKPGTYVVVLPTPRQRLRASVRIEMRNEKQQLFVDEFVVSFNDQFLSVLKWILVLPLALCAAVVYFVVGKSAPKRIKSLDLAL